MDELSKVKRVIEKQTPIDEVLLVLDATTGQNGLAQAKVFAEAVDVTGVVLTKLDGDTRGGAALAAAATATQLGVTAHKLRTAGDPSAAWALTGMSLAATVHQLGASLNRHHWPLALAAATLPRKVA